MGGLSVAIAIDGPSGVGKSTVAKCLAQTLGYHYVDSGSMYRVMGWVAINAAVSLDAEELLIAVAEEVKIEMTFNSDGQSEIRVNAQRVTSELRGERIGAAASAVATIPAVRNRITEQLRRVREQGHLVMEGRDIGTVVFPDATAKFFLDSSLDVRGRRRFDELRRAGQTVEFVDVLSAVRARDEQDRSRVVAPLVPACGAHVIDATDLSVDEVVQRMLSDIHL